jgi:hypothetical protein
MYWMDEMGSSGMKKRGSFICFFVHSIILVSSFLNVNNKRYQ